MLQKRLAKLREEREGEHGFTLIELLVVVVIIGVLIAIAIPVYLNYQKGAHDKSADSDLRNAVSVLEQCNSDNGSYPTVVSSTGTMTGCDGQTINLSSNTAVTYFPSTASAPSAYIMETTNTSGTSKVFYCYASAAGGSVQQSGQTAVGAYAGTCPAKGAA